jgi:N6-L-threonylcarbamoyladenine synthase
VAVNHLEGHAVSARLGASIDYPFLLLLVSGGHCQLLEVAGVGACTRLGTTIDDAAGEAFDKIAKSLGLPYPGGPALETLAATGDPTKFDLPRALLGRKDCDFSFSGLKTAAARLAEKVTDERQRADLAAAVQFAIARQLSERTDRAMKLYAASAMRARPCASSWPAGWRPTARCARRCKRTAPTTASRSTPRPWPTAPTTPP